MNFTWVPNLQENKSSSAASFRSSSGKGREAAGQSATRPGRALNALLAAQQILMPAPGGPVVFGLPQEQSPAGEKNPLPH